MLYSILDLKKMKKLINWFLFLTVIGITFLSCQSEEETKTPEILIEEMANSQEIDSFTSFNKVSFEQIVTHTRRVLEEQKAKGNDSFRFSSLSKEEIIEILEASPNFSMDEFREGLIRQSEAMHAAFPELSSLGQSQADSIMRAVKKKNWNKRFINRQSQEIDCTEEFMLEIDEIHQEYDDKIAVAFILLLFNTEAGVFLAAEAVIEAQLGVAEALDQYNDCVEG